LRSQNLGKSEVNQLDASILVNHDVLRFDISVNDVVPLQSFQGAHDLRGVKLDPLPFVVLREFHMHLVLNDPVEILPGQILKHKVDSLLVCKGFVQIDNEVKRKRRAFRVVDNVAASLRSVLGAALSVVLLVLDYCVRVNTFQNVGLDLLQKFKDELFIFQMLDSFRFIDLFFRDSFHGEKVVVMYY